MCSKSVVVTSELDFFSKNCCGDLEFALLSFNTLYFQQHRFLDFKFCFPFSPALLVWSLFPTATNEISQPHQDLSASVVYHQISISKMDSFPLTSSLWLVHISFDTLKTLTPILLWRRKVFIPFDTFTKFYYSLSVIMWVLVREQMDASVSRCARPCMRGCTLLLKLWRRGDVLESLWEKYHLDFELIYRNGDFIFLHW